MTPQKLERIKENFQTETLRSLMSFCYSLVEHLPEGQTKWLVEFAGECLETALFEHDEKSPKELLTKLLQEYLAELEVEKEEQG